MTSVSKRKFGFTSVSVYRRREPHAFAYLSERATFWIAVLSVFAFVTGNMIGQHGWAVFWKSVMGEGSDSMIVFTGMAPPIAQVPDFERWGRMGGSVHTHTFRQVPRDLLGPLPRYVSHGDDLHADPALKSVYFVEHLGTYETGRGKGSHPGEDISAPEGTPVLSVANGIIDKVSDDAGGYGKYVMIRHPNVPDAEKKGEMSTVYSIYAHLSSALVQPGQVVMKGDQIALSGKTGFATAPHLHFQMEKASAPFHPYWPFTGTEQREAKMSFVQAIDAGLHRERGLAYTLDPMLTVQAYQSYQAPVTLAAASSPSSVKARPLTIADRRQLRLSRMGASSSVITTLIAYTDNVPVIPIPVPASSSSAPSTASAPLGSIRSVRISHDGSFTKTRGWEKVTLMLMDSEGRVVVSPSSSDKLYLLTAYGRAEFRPSVVSLSDFRNGVTVVEMLPLGEQTVVPQVHSTDGAICKVESCVGKPMKYGR